MLVCGQLGSTRDYQLYKKKEKKVKKVQGQSFLRTHGEKMNVPGQIKKNNW